MLQRFKLGTKLALVVALALAAVTTVAVVGYTTLQKVEIGSDAYQRSIEYEQLIADVLPPPQYVVESYLTANRVLRSNGTNMLLAQVALGTDVSGTLPVANGGTGITSLGTGVATFLGTPSSANLASAVTDETGSGSLVFGTSPTLSSPRVDAALTVQQIATPSNPSAGFDKIYTKSDGLLYKLDSAGNEVAVGSGAGGGGELNLVINPDGDTALDGNRTNDVGDWIDDATAGTGTTSSKTTTSTEIPLFPTKTNAIKVLNDGSGTGYTRLRMTLPQSLYNRKLKIAWEQEASTSPAYVSGDFRVELWSNAAADYSGAYTELPLSTDVSGNSALPALTGRYQTTFDTSTAANLELRIVRVAGAVNSFLSFNNVTVGPGIQPQGAVVGEWQSYTGTVANGGTATFAYVSRLWRRVGDSIEIKYGFSVTANGSGSSIVKVPMPSNLTVDLSSMSNETAVGFYSKYNGTQYVAGAAMRTVTATTDGVAFQEVGTADSIFGSDLVNGHSYYINFTVKVSEWAGSGTVQLAQNDVEYAWNSSTSTSASDSTSFGYGPSGAQIQNITAIVVRRVRFNSPIQAGDSFSVEVSTDRVKWLPINNAISDYVAWQVTPYFQANTSVTYGIGNIKIINNTDIEVSFGGYASAYSATTWGGAGHAWSAGAGSLYWRVRKSSAGAAVGFGIVSGSSAGLLPASNANLDDATATRLGLKQYLHGTTYNGGNAPTVTSAQAGFSVIRALFVPYQVQDGTWRLRFNIMSTFTSASIATVSVSINGITTKNVANAGPALHGLMGSSTAYFKFYMPANSSSITAETTSATTCNGIYCGGDIELESKPTWAY
jgi:hypothetical protein